MPGRHIDREFESELDQLRQKLILMAGRVEEMIRQAIKAIVTGDSALARNTVLMDRGVNRAEREIDELCLLILAKRHPLASDLRFVTLALKMVTDLERIGDLAVNLCERAVDLAGRRLVVPTSGIERLADAVQAMVRSAIDAFVAHDVDRAEAVIASDDHVDDGYHDLFEAILAAMTADPTAIEEGIHLQSVCKVLERIGDHATNLAEEVIFLVRGTDVRHAGKLME